MGYLPTCGLWFHPSCNRDDGALYSIEKPAPEFRSLRQYSNENKRRQNGKQSPSFRGREQGGFVGRIGGAFAQEPDPVARGMGQAHPPGATADGDERGGNLF